MTDTNPQSTSAPGASHLPPETVLGVALDMDGLLFDTERLYWDVGDRLLTERGRRFCAELQQRMMGRIGVAAIQEMIDFHSLDDEPHELLAQSDAIYSELLGAGPQEMFGMPQLIETLRQRSIPFGIATSSRAKFALRILQAQPWYDSLHFVLTGDDVRHGKPHPEMYHKAADRLGIAPSRMLVLEDSGNGSAAGVAAGAVVIAVPTPHTRHHAFTNVHAIAESLADPVIYRLLGA
jgi:HAD superfamily hydrolase (TIGR01509 family)